MGLDERERLWRTTGIRPPVAVWDVQHLARFLEGMQNDPLFALWWLLVMRGPRRGEVTALRGQDFDFFDRTMWIREQIIAVDGVDHIGPPKSMAGVRLLALDEFTNQLLWRHWLFQHRRFAGTGRNPDGYMFTHADGRPVRPDWLTRRFARLVRQLDLPPVRLHDVRHAHASLAGAAGVPLKVRSVFAKAAHAAVAATAQLLRSHAKLRMTLAEASQA
jgi:integrase